MTQTTFQRTESDFVSHGTRCTAWLYKPQGVDRPPAVVMAHGFAAEKVFALPAFAERFASQGLAVLLFDYRCFGDSDGKPRNLVNPFKHVQDWKAAVGHVRSLPGLDHQRVALWGTSLGGGHVIMTAAQDPEIAAIVCQVPYVDPFASFGMFGLKDMLKGFAAGIRDVVRMMTFRAPYYIPVVGDPGTPAFLNAPGAMEGYLSIIPEGYQWSNRCPARVIFTVARYRPIARAKRVRCPALILAAEEDNLVPLQSLEKAAAKIGSASLVKLQMGHFDVYRGRWFARAVGEELAFLQEKLCVPA